MGQDPRLGTLSEILRMETDKMRLGRILVNLCLNYKPRIFHLNNATTSHSISRNMASRTGEDLKSDQEELRIVWMDLEMTGLDPDTDHILEVACAITDSNLRLIAQHGTVVHQDDEVLKNMNEWCQVQHKKSGLLEAVQKSNISLKEAEQETLNFIKEYTIPQLSPLAGNTVYMDKFFLMKYMPEVVKHLHYRIIDVSTVKELARRFNPVVLKQAEISKKQSHRATDDILESIAEMKLYKDRFLKVQTSDSWTNVE